MTRGLVAVIDETDADLVLPHRWCAMAGSNKGQHLAAVRSVRLPCGSRRLLYMHRAIMGLEHGDPREVDHRDFYGLNNRRSNLVVVSGKANKQHQPARAGSSNYVGVTFDRSRGKWRAQIGVDGRTINLGRFATEREAVERRDAAVRSLGSAHALNGGG